MVCDQSILLRVPSLHVPPHKPAASCQTRSSLWLSFPPLCPVLLLAITPAVRHPVIYYTAIRIGHCRASVNNCQIQTAVLQCRTCLYSHFWATFLCYTCQLAHGESVLAVWQQQLGLTVAYCSSSDADAASHRTWGWGTNDDRWPSLVLVA